MSAEFEDEEEVEENDEAVVEDVTEGTEPESEVKTQNIQATSGHLVPSTNLEFLDAWTEIKLAEQLAAKQYPYKEIAELGEKNLQGVAYEAIVQRHLEDKYGKEAVEKHPNDLSTSDGQEVQPDFLVRQDNSQNFEIHDAKGYQRKLIDNANPKSYEITHMSNLKKSARYVNIDDEKLDAVVFEMPRETADLDIVKHDVATLGGDKIQVRIESVGSEAEIKQRMEHLRTPEEGRFSLPEELIEEITRILEMPANERKEAFGSLVLSLHDIKEDESSLSVNLRQSSEVNENGNITIRDWARKKTYIIEFQ